jgi:squalene synthase HpnC
VSVEHYENFPVASWLCPPALRPAVKALYWFARTADDLADEGDAPAAARLEALAAYRDALEAAIADRPDPQPRWPQVFDALRQTLRRHRLPASLLRDLLSAFEQDVHNPPYRDRAELLDYCRRSANPVGRLLLSLYGVDDAAAACQSDAVCSALQLINFWQDLSRDLPRGRCYVPESDLQRHGLSRADLATGADTPAARALVAELCGWSQQLMLDGAPLVHRLPGRIGWELRLVVQGGLRVLEKIRRMDHATLSRRPALNAGDAAALLLRALRMRRPRVPV